jgi:malonate transporter
MLSIFLTILPVFLLVGVGYASARLKYLDAAVSDHLNAFAVRLAVPALLFMAMVRVDLGQAYQPGMLLSFYCGALSVFVAAIVLARTIWKRRPGEAVAIGFCAMFSNTVLLGIAIMERAYGKEALTPVFGIISLHAPSLYALGMITMELSRRDGRPLGETLKAAMKSILGNSLMIGIMAGLAVNLSGIKLPEPVLAAGGMLAAAAIPAALVGIGAAMTRYAVRAELSESVMMSALALVLHPAIAFVLAHHVLALPVEQVRAAVVLAAMPPGMNGYIFAVIYKRAESLNASAILVATALSVVTITAWLTLLERVAG